VQQQPLAQQAINRKSVTRKQQATSQSIEGHRHRHSRGADRSIQNAGGGEPLALPARPASRPFAFAPSGGYGAVQTMRAVVLEPTHRQNNNKAKQNNTINTHTHTHTQKNKQNNSLCLLETLLKWSLLEIPLVASEGQSPASFAHRPHRHNLHRTTRIDRGFGGFGPPVGSPAFRIVIWQA
jgi:hypothetical protein